jgi:4-amino-4-deoxy-L-arabinose transferase-like glycosyltransferase
MRAVWMAVAAGFLLRAAFGLVYWTDKPLTHDEREYLTLAANVAQGRGFAQELPGEPADPRIQQFGRAPLYPLFLAPLTWTSAELRAGRLPAHVPPGVKLAQAAVGALGVWLLAAIVRRVAGEPAARAAAWLGAVYPPLVWIPAYALSEALYSTLALACVLCLGALVDVRPAGEGRTRHAALVAAALLAGLAALTRPAMLFFLPIAVGLLWARASSTRAGLTRAAVFALVALVPIVPWTIRNARVYDRPVLIASEGGVTFWTGNHREATGEGDLAANPQLKRRNQEFRARHAGLTEAELEPLYYREAFGFVRDDPARWAGLLARKLWYTVVPTGPSYRLHSPLYYWASVISYGLVLPVALVGLARAPRGGRPLALVGLAASAVLVCLVFFPQERFRIPVIDPALIAGAALTRRPR